MARPGVIGALVIIAIIVAISIFSFTKTTGVTFRLGPSNTAETITVGVTLPLDDNEACKIARSAANAYGVKTFTCSRIRRIDANEIEVIDRTTTQDTPASTIITINEKEKVITFFGATIETRTGPLSKEEQEFLRQARGETAY